ncbi:hypothetical protein J6590_073636 [Homalodisca vitripennis]|nr:hypothetical protein J6590_073636 [Homalodisca vitripennis]
MRISRIRSDPQEREDGRLKQSQETKPEGRSCFSPLVHSANNIGRGASAQHGMHLKRNTKHLLAQELIEFLRKMDSTASRVTSQPPVTARGLQNNERKSDQALESPTAPISTILQSPAASEPRTLLYESFAEAVKCRSPVRQVGPSSTITDTTEQKNCFPLKCQKAK